MVTVMAKHIFGACVSMSSVIMGINGDVSGDALLGKSFISFAVLSHAMRNMNNCFDFGGLIR
jgi:hypothetical protein